MRTAKTDQTGRLPRLIWVFAGRTCHIVGFVMMWLIYRSRNNCGFFSLYSAFWRELGPINFLSQYWHLGVSPVNNSDSNILWNTQENTWAVIWQNQQSECAPSEDSDQPGHPPNLISLRCQRRSLASHWAHSEDSDQADLSLRWAHTHFVGFVMSRLI